MVIPSLIPFQSIPDDDIDLMHLAFVVAQEGSGNHFSVAENDVVQAQEYIKTLGTRVRARRHDLIMSGADDDARTDLAALKHVLVDQDGFAGPPPGTYDHLENANIISVMNRRCGLPIAIAIIYAHASLSSDITVSALDFPGHVVMRVERAGQMIMFDPSHLCKTLDAADLRAILKQSMGPQVELKAAYYTPLTRRGMIVRLQNNIKLRLIEQGHYKDAVHILEIMRLVDPNEYRVLFDLGVLYEKLNDIEKAINCLGDYLAALPPRHPNRGEAMDLWTLLQKR